MSTIKDMLEETQSQRTAKAELLARAKAVGLDNHATEAQVVKAEAEQK